MSQASTATLPAAGALPGQGSGPEPHARTREPARKARCDEEQARALTAKIRSAADDLWRLLTEAHEREAWRALGYSGFREYVHEEFGMDRTHAYRLISHGQFLQQIEDAAKSVAHGLHIPEMPAERVTREIRRDPAAVEEVKGKVQAGASPIEATYSVIEARRVDPSQEAPQGAPELSSPPEHCQETERSAEPQAQGEAETLRLQLAEAVEKAAYFEDLVQSYDTATSAEHQMAKEIADLRGQLRTVASQRDQYMTTCAELRKEVKRLMRKLGQQA